MGTYGALKAGGIQGGWDKFFKGIETAGQVASGAGQAAGAVATAGAVGSDIRLKENIVFIGELQGQKIYKFNYIGKPEVNIGVMAQDIESDHPDCIVPKDGFMYVNYNKLFKEA